MLDPCRTPLRPGAVAPGRTEGGLVTRQATIAGPPVAPPVDLVLAHSVLSFLTPEEVPLAGDFFRDSLRPGGRLVMATALKRVAPKPEAVTFRHHVLAELAARSVPFPGGEAHFGALLEDYAHGRSGRGSPFATSQDLDEWLAGAGFRTEAMIDLRRGFGFAPDGRPLARTTGGVLAVARRDGAR